MKNLKYIIKKRIKHVAFTLAEVLIVLGIIGVVAAMTIPNLMHNYRKSMIETSLKKFYTTVNQAIKLSEIDNGASQDWDTMTDLSSSSDKSLTDDEKNEKMAISTEAWFEKYLSKYIRVIKKGHNNALFYTILDDGTAVAWHSYAIYVYPRGEDFIKCTNLGITALKKECSAKKCWVFLWYGKTYVGKGIEPWGYDNSVSALKSSSSNGCNTNFTNEPAACTAIIAKNGWKIPDDYPFKI